MFNFDTYDIKQQLINDMNSMGIAPVENINFIFDGQIHRYKVSGDKNSETSGAYCIWLDYWPAGWLYNWRNGVHVSWHFNRHNLKNDDNSSLDEDKYLQAIQKAKLAQKLYCEQLIEKQKKASDNARATFSALVSAPENFPYLVRKNVPNFGLRYRHDLNQIAVPLYNINGDIQSIQWINKEGSKLFFKDAPIKEAFFSVGLDLLQYTQYKDLPILIGEGYATMATVHELTRYPVVAAMTCHNLIHVAKALKNTFPLHKIIFIADNDHLTEGNPGLSAANEAQASLNSSGVVLPAFSNEQNGSDWNDFFLLYGSEFTKLELKKQIDFCLMPQNIKLIHKHVQIINAQELRRKSFPPVKWAVEGFLPAGLSILAGGPKIGKSILALHLSVGVAIGGCVLGKIFVQQGDVLYLALEDTQRRLQERINGSDILDDNADLSHLDLITEIPRQHQGGATYIQFWLENHPEARLVVIDTLQMFRKQLSGKGSMYSEDYDVISNIKAIGDSFNVPILILHHLKKAGEGDWLNELSGSQGLAGSADTIFSLKRSRTQNLATLHRTGRDVEEKDFILKLDGFGWVLQGEAEQFTMPEWKRQILDFLKENDSVTPMQLAELHNIALNTAQQNLRRLAKEGEIKKIGYGTYGLAE